MDKNTVKSIILENDVLRIELLPGMGGKIISFFRKDKEFELAAGGGRDEHVRPDEKDGFEPYAYGMDEAFPNIDVEEVEWKGRRLCYPDHGEIWKSEFQILEQSGAGARLIMNSPEFGYQYEKRLTLEGDSLKIAYHIVNTGKEELPCIWTWHGLMRYEEDMEIILPEEIRHCRNVLPGSVLGEGGEVYPADGSFYDFRRVPASNPRSMVKYYGEEKVIKGCCGFRYPSHGTKCLMSYDAGILPYFGVWITAGGFQGDYNCALEPSSGFYDGIGTARSLGKLPVLGAGERMEFGICVMLI